MPIAAPLGFVPMPPSFLLLFAAILVGYIATAEFVKRRFYRDGEQTSRLLKRDEPRGLTR
jgi:hypothetical protein